MERCNEDDFRVCDLAIAPRTLTAVAFHPEVTYLRVEQCVLVAAGSATNDEQEEADELWECLNEPLPAEYYGAVNYGGGLSSGSGDGTGGSVLMSHWPSSVDVDFSVAPLCEQVTLSKNFGLLSAPEGVIIASSDPSAPVVPRKAYFRTRARLLTGDGIFFGQPHKAFAPNHLLLKSF